MPALLLYLLKANVALVLFYLAYHLVLRKLTFYHLNRLFLAFGIVFSAVYPLVDLSELFSRHEELAAMQSYAVVLPTWNTSAIPEQAAAFDYWAIPVALFWLGCAVMLVRLVIQFISLYGIHRTSVPASYQGVDFRKVKGISEAFSFWKTIYLNPAQHQSPELESILRHEQIHVNGWHTLDVLLAELSTVFYWFNPGVWLMKKAMKENLEFIADQHVVNAGVDRVAYQYLLLKVVGATQPQIANQFNFPSLKRRIAMMNKMPTSKANRLRLLVVLPLATVLLFAFQNATPLTESIANTAETETLQQTGDSQLPIELVEILKNILTNNPAIKSVRGKVVDNRNAVVISLKGGGTEVYYVDSSESIAALERKYGLPGLPAPPAPVQGENESFTLKLEDLAYYKNKENWPADYKDFLSRHPNVKEVGWKFDNRRDYNLESIIIYLKNGKSESYDYNRNSRIPAAEAKWGQLPSLPTPPPPVRAPEAPQSDVKSTLPAEGLYFIDGVESTREAAQQLDPKEIHSMHVIKGDHATNTFGKTGAKGVISIITEKNKDSKQVQEFNKKLPTPPAPPAPGAPAPPPAPAAPGTPPAPPAPPVPAKEQLPPPPPPVRYEGPAIPKAGGARLVENEEYVVYTLWPEEITKRELEVAQQAFKDNGFDLKFTEKTRGGKITDVAIELISKKNGNNAHVTRSYNANGLKDLLEADNIVLVQGNKKTGEVRIATTLAPRDSIYPPKKDGSPKSNSIRPNKKNDAPESNSLYPPKKGGTPKSNSIKPNKKEGSPESNSMTPTGNRLTAQVDTVAGTAALIKKVQRDRQAAGHEATDKLILFLKDKQGKDVDVYAKFNGNALETVRILATAN